MSDSKNEKILGVAFKLIKPENRKDEILQDPFPTSHLTFLNKLSREHSGGLHAVDGFYSNKRKFLTRAEAYEVAENANQLLNSKIKNDRLYAKNIISPCVK